MDRRSTRWQQEAEHGIIRLGMNIKRFLLGLILVIFFIFAAVGALTLIRQNKTISTITTDTLCNPPCWQNIQPGQTTAWEAVSILEKLQYVEGIMQWDERYGDKIAWAFRYPVRESSGYIYCAEDRVMAISFLTYESITVAEAFEYIGEPDYSWMRYKETFGRQWLEVVLAYPTQGIFTRVDLELSDAADRNFTVRIDENSPIGRVVYFDPIQYEYLLNSHILFREDEQMIMERHQPWQGLGVIDYEFLVPD